MAIGEKTGRFQWLIKEGIRGVGEGKTGEDCRNYVDAVGLTPRYARRLGLAIVRTEVTVPYRTVYNCDEFIMKTESIHKQHTVYAVSSGYSIL